METGVTSASACDPDLVWIGTFIFFVIYNVLSHYDCNFNLSVFQINVSYLHLHYKIQNVMEV